MAPMTGWTSRLATTYSLLSRVAEVVRRASRAELGLAMFITAFALGNAALYHRSLFAFAAGTLDYRSLNGALTMITLFVLVVFVSSLLLAMIALVAQRLVKPVCMLIVCGNALALYFVETYHIVLDRTMMGNVFNTNPQEAGELFHPKLLFYLLFFGILPCLFLARLRIRRTGMVRRFVYLLVVLLLGSGWSFANARTWLWIDKHASKLGGVILPWSYVINSIRWYHGSHFRASRQATLLPTAHFVAPGKTIVVLVIGESARAQNFSLYGYRRDTNPNLAKAGVVALPETTACSTYTTASIECMLSHLGSGTSVVTLHEPLPSYMQRSGVNVIWRSNNWGEPLLNIGLYQRAEDLRKTCLDAACRYDGVLLHDLERALKTSVHDKTLVVLHQHGSHGPSYYKNVPDSFVTFKPVCESVDLQQCTNEELVNAYDNTVLYTDHLLSRVIDILKATRQPAVMLYISDHGESLGEFGLYLHGAPYSIAPQVQKQVPFIVWMSDEFKKQRKLSNVDIGKAGQHSHDHVFHSVMGALELRGDVYNKRLDIFNTE